MSDETTHHTEASMKPDIQSIVDLIQTGKATQIVVLVGAGISTSAGIPDFRTPNTGLYDKLAPLQLPCKEAIFDARYLWAKPQLFYTLARALHPGNFKPTVSHVFLALLARKNLLHLVITQNFDELEEDAGVPHKIYWAHGNWKSQHCIRCKKPPYFDDLVDKAILAGEIPRCYRCNGPVQPDIVFFGQYLTGFEEEERKVREADLMLVMGTSLRVPPCSTLPTKVEEGVPRVLINNEKAGDLGDRNEDVCILGSCDDGVRQLADALGWGEDERSLEGSSCC